MRSLTLPFLAFATVLPLTATPADWPMWGGQFSRNMVAPTSPPLPTEFEPGQKVEGTETIDMKTTRGVRWVAKLGSQSYGNPVVADGRVYVGTNNESPRNDQHIGDRGVLMCFDEKSGELLWQLVVPKSGAGKVSDWEYVGICSAPYVEGNRLWLVSNRGEIMCLDVRGQDDGNDGPFQDEAKFMEVDGKAVTLGKTDADIIWVYDTRDELGVFPHNVASCSPIVVDGRLFTATSNGMDWSHTNIPAPLAPALIVLDAETGALLGEEVAGVSKRVLHASWSSPAFGSDQMVWGGGDGWIYGFEPVPVEGEDGLNELKELWRCDGNPPEYRTRDGKPLRYATPNGPSEVIGTVVLAGNRGYVVIGQDPEHGDGVGALTCIDISKRGDISESGIIWRYKGVGRSISTPSVADGLVYVGEYAGKIHCLDADSGEVYWVHDTESRMWGSTLVADGKVFIGNEDGDLVVLATGREKKVLGKVNLGAAVYSSAVAANGTLYVATQTHLYAVDGKGAGQAEADGDAPSE